MESRKGPDLHELPPDLPVPVDAMPGIETSKLKESDLLQTRGW